MRFDRDARCIADQSVLGEEDPGAAMDTFYRSLEIAAPLPAYAPPVLANPESPSVAAAEIRAASLARVSSIEALTRARLLTVNFDTKLADVAALLSGAQLSVLVVCDPSGAVTGVIAGTRLIQHLGLGDEE